MGCLFPGADGLARYWTSIRRAVDAIGDVPESHWAADDYFDADPKAPDRTYARRGGFLDPVEFPPMEYGITPNAIEAIDTTQLLGLMVARRALEDAGYGEAGKALDRDRVGVILGVTGTLELVIPLGARLGHPIWRRALRDSGVDQSTADEVVRRISDSYVGWQENSFPGLLGNVAAGRIANRLDLRGTNCVVDAACASSLAAVNLALLELASGRSDMVVTGGLDTFNDIFMYMCFSKTPALSPTGEARPFDAGADGTILGEGLGVLVLKRLDDARRDGDRVYAVIRSMGTSSDGRGQAVYAPSAAGQARALREAYRLAGVSPATVGLVEAHGTGTRVGDATELEALGEVYRGGREGGPWCAIGSVKSQVGHTKAAAGAAGLIKAALALHHKVLPPTLKVRRPAEALAREDSPFYLNDAARPWPASADAPRRAAVSAFGFGGSNFHCVLEEAEPEKLAADWDGDVQILAFSADDPQALVRQLDALPDPVRWPEVRTICARTRADFRVEGRYRLLVVVERGGRDLSALIAEARDRVEATAADGANGRRYERSRPEGGEARVFAGSGSTPGSLALLFPGQGSQYVGMLRELACQFPRMQSALGAADRELNAADSRRLSDRIYPPSAFDDRARDAHEAALRDTRFAQPAIGAISLGLLGVLDDFGVRPDLVGGHSFGELTALRAAGRIDDATFWRLARVRGALMGDCAAAGTGGMLAAFAAADRVEAALREHRLDLVIANRNAPAQCVLSGPSPEIERAGKVLTERGIGTRVLPVSAAFHSRFVESARVPFRRELAAADLRPAAIPVFANSTAEAYPAEPELARDLLAEQLARPVRFVEQVEAMYRAGARTFLEVGPGARLTGLVRATLEGRAHAAFSVDASSGARGNAVDLACALATLAALGYAVDLSRWDAGGAAEPVAPRRPGPTVSISGANLRPTVRDAEKPRPRAVELESVLPTPRRAGVPPAIAARLPAGESEEDSGASALALPPRYHAGNDRMTNPVQGPLCPPRNNGHAPAGTMAIAEPAGPPGSRVTDRLDATAKVRPDELHRAIREGQENLEALQRLAEHTAELHRLFLQGQEKVQQTFARLLEQRQELTRESRAFVEADGSSAGIQPVNGRPEPAHARVGAPVAAGKSAVLRNGAEEPHAAPSPVRPRPDSAAANGHGSPPAAPAERRTPEVVAQAEVRAVAAPSAGSATSGQAVAALLEVVSEKTGYPAEVLGLDMRLDDDLGIDSIKRVEILSALQERYPGLPSPSPERLASFRTLGAIGEYLQGASEAEVKVTVGTAVVAAKSEGDDEVARTLLATVAEKTGYPVEMLELEMKLDDDLGIDSIKRVEILSALQERLPWSTNLGPDVIGTLRTLGDVAATVRLSRGGEPSNGDIGARQSRFDEARIAPEVAASIPDGRDAAGEAAVARVLLEAVAEKTGYPVEMLELGMRLDDDLGIDSIKRVEILSAVQDRLPETQAIGPDQAGALQTLGDIVVFLSGSQVEESGRCIPGANDGGCAARGEVSADDGVALRLLVPRIRTLPRHDARETLGLPAGGMVGILDDGTELTGALRSELEARGFRSRVIRGHDTPDILADEAFCGLIVLARAGSADLASEGFRWIRAVGPALERAARAGCASLVTVSRLDGRFGIEGLRPEVDVASGAMAGLAKTAAREWPSVACKALDLGSGLGPVRQAASAIADEFVICGPDEVGLDGERRLAVEVVPAVRPRRSDAGRARLGPDDLVVISGGARGITAEVAVALAREFRVRLLLLGRSAAPAAEEDAELLACRDEAALRRYLSTGPERGRSPQVIGETARRILAAREVRANLARMAAAGSRVEYRSVDVRDRAAVAELIARARAEWGPVRALIHGAGVLADRRILDQTDEQFALVYRTKVAGLQNLFDAIDPEELTFLGLFSSSTARYGRAGQVAYAAANEYLNKWAQRAAVRWPDCRVVSFNWGPWAGGMVDSALRTVFEKEGLGLIPTELGAQLVVDEIRAEHSGPGPVEVVVLAGDLPAAPIAVPAEHRVAEAPTPVAPAAQRLETVHRRRVDVSSMPVLADHVIDGRPVVPMAILLEWCAEGALQRNPGLVVCGVDDLRLFKGLVLGDGERDGVTLEVGAGKCLREGDTYRVPVELRSVTPEGRESLHCRANVLLAARHPAPPRRAEGLQLPPCGWEVDRIYTKTLFHGPAMQGIQAVEGAGERGITGQVLTAPSPSRWVDRPLRSRWITDPLAIDCAFQLVVLWTHEQLGASSLPTAVGRYRQYRPDFGGRQVRVAAEIREASPSRAVADIQILDARGEVVASIESYECVVDASLARAFRRNRLVDSIPVNAS